MNTRDVVCWMLGAALALLSMPAGAQGGGQYKLVFRDEFDLPDGSQPDTSVWRRSKRYWSTWNRWISRSDRVVFIKNGRLVCRAVRNTAEPSDTAAMLTGAVETQGKFSFKYGKIEVRMRTKRHRGNFPAAWLLPQPPCRDWPGGGEIDIFETIDNENKAHHSVHSHWTYVLKKKEQPHTWEVAADVEKWHVYGLVWTPTSLTWTIDGAPTASYRKSSDKAALDSGQWPFDHPFYIVLNQSVGRKGGWAAAPDPKFVYETQFDWVRVYQLDGR